MLAVWPYPYFDATCDLLALQDLMPVATVAAENLERGSSCPLVLPHLLVLLFSHISFSYHPYAFFLSPSLSLSLPLSLSLSFSLSLLFACTMCCSDIAGVVTDMGSHVCATPSACRHMSVCDEYSACRDMSLCEYSACRHMSARLLVCESKHASPCRS